MTGWAENREFAALEKDYWRDRALEFDCDEPGCGAGVGKPCRSVHDGEPLVKQPAHWRRIKAAEEAS